MKNILSSLNESEKKRILEMHYKASNRHYLNEAVNADYNVIKTSMDATYGETMKTYLMSTVTLQGQDDTGKPTQIKFNPTNPLGTIKRKSKTTGTDYEVDVIDPVYSCVDGVFLERFESVIEYQKAYASSIGATEQTAASAARSTWETELKKIGAAGCKAISDLSKGLPNPLIKVTTSNVPQEKKPLPATKGSGKVVNTRLVSAGPQTVITAEDMKTVGLSANEIPRITADGITQSGYDAAFGGSFFFGPLRFECAPGTQSDSGKPQYRLSGNANDLYEPQKSAWITYKPQITAILKKQCIANANWVKTAQYEYLNDKGEVIKTGKFDFNVSKF